jgi:phage-related protein
MKMHLPRKARPDLVPKPVRWIGESQNDLSAFPNDVKLRVGGALWDAQVGLKSPVASRSRASPVPA